MNWFKSNWFASNYFASDYLAGSAVVEAETEQQVIEFPGPWIPLETLRVKPKPNITPKPKPLPKFTGIATQAANQNQTGIARNYSADFKARIRQEDEELLLILDMISDLENG